MAKSLFIEGTDGSGKSTQFALLKEYLEKKGIEYLAIREPGGSTYYEALRDFLLQSEFEHPPVSDALLSAAGRAANMTQAKKSLLEGKWVISDRAYPSSYVYQAAQGLDLAQIKSINQHALGDFTFDIKILLDIPVDIAANRISNGSAKKDHWESQGKEFFEDIRQKYLELAEEENFTVIDASKDIAAVQQEIVAALGM